MKAESFFLFFLLGLVGVNKGPKERVTKARIITMVLVVDWDRLFVGMSY